MMKVFSGSSNPKLAERVANNLGVKLGVVDLFKFSDGEIGINICEQVLREDVFIIQTGSKPVNDHLMEMLILIDAFRRAGTASITAIMPWLPYSRKEKKDHRQDAISGRLVADLLEKAGIDRLIALDLHADAVEGFFHVPVVNMSAVKIFTEHLVGFDPEQTVVVAPDMGGAKRARRFAKALGVPVVILEKIRKHNSSASEVVTIIGDVTGKRAIIVDDIVSTGGTLINAANILKQRGAEVVEVFVSHAILADDATTKIGGSDIDRLTITDSIPVTQEKMDDKIEVISIASLISDEIKRLQPYMSFVK